MFFVVIIFYFISFFFFSPVTIVFPQMGNNIIPSVFVFILVGVVPSYLRMAVSFSRQPQEKIVPA